MSSNIKGIYTALANMRVGSVKARNINKVKLSIKAADLPIRLLLPGTKGEGEFVAMGTSQKMIWTIRDLCIWAPLTMGKGIEQFAESMVDYMALYIEAVKNNRFPVNCTNILSWEIQLGPIPWADTDYWSIDCTLTVEEQL